MSYYQYLWADVAGFETGCKYTKLFHFGKCFQKNILVGFCYLWRRVWSGFVTEGTGLSKALKRPLIHYDTDV